MYLRITAIIQARMGSSRLPGKVMKPVFGRPLLGLMLDRVSKARSLSEVVVATTTQPEDDVIPEFVTHSGYNVYRGSETDVLDRYYKAASEFKSDVIVRLTADCPLIDPQVIDLVVGEFLGGAYDFVSNTEPLPSTWPDGMDVSVFSYPSLERAWTESRKPSEREHVTFFFWNNAQLFNNKRIECEKNLGHYRLTVDYPEDFELVRQLVEKISSMNKYSIETIGLHDIINIIKKTPALECINDKYVRGSGWVASFQRDEELGL